MIEVTGALHIHSTYSDGSGSVEEVERAAAAAGLDFILITDHNSIAAFHDIGEHMYRNLYVGFGVEVSPDQNHYLAFGLPGTTPAENDPPQEIVRQVHEAGGIGFLAHPNDHGNPLLRLPSYAWTARDVTGYTGLEVWNVMSDFVGATRSIFRLFAGLLFPVAFLKGPDPATLAWWDEENRRRFTPGVGGLDLHAYRAGPLTVFPYRRSFGMLLMHVFLESDARPDARAFGEDLLGALAGGRSYFANHEVQDPRGFSFDVGGALPGEEVAYREGLTATVTFPTGAFTLLRDGKRVVSGGTLWTIPRPGSYRLEGRVGGRPWLFTNPVRVTD